MLFCFDKMLIFEGLNDFILLWCMNSFVRFCRCLIIKGILIKKLLLRFNDDIDLCWFLKRKFGKLIN